MRYRPSYNQIDLINIGSFSEFSDLVPEKEEFVGQQDKLDNHDNDFVSLVKSLTPKAGMVRKKSYPKARHDPEKVVPISATGLQHGTGITA